MRECATCGRENPEDARYCNTCGAELVRPKRRHEQRKVVTVLFCDIVGSTALGESTDPEALRARMRRYFEDLRVIIERHGGTVEKFVGDAVMAVFGRFFLPTVAAYLAETLLSESSASLDEVEALCSLVREKSISGDLVNFVVLDATEARTLSRRGRTEEAVPLARRAVAAADSTDYLGLRSKSRLALVEVLRSAGDQAGRDVIATEVLSLHEAKGDMTGRAWARGRLELLGVELR